MDKMDRRQFLCVGAAGALSTPFASSGSEKNEEREDVVTILAYHNIRKDPQSNDLYSVRPDEFRRHLEILHKKGYRLERLDSLIDEKINTERKGKPLILSYDDAWDGQFRLLDDNTIDPDCAVGITQDFCREYRDFGDPHGIFFASFDKGSAFGNSSHEEDKFKYLLDNGYEIGSHTYDHKFLDKASPKVVEEQISRADERLRKRLGSRADEVRMFCYPGGRMPNEAGMKIIRDRFDGAVRSRRFFKIEKSPYPLPKKLKYDIPRVAVFKDVGYVTLFRL